ncbi:membrane integrity-associated transporter subunit PqiC [Candidatus Methylospira mobilis]|uniref:Membrane integrity-associated transporter subunit PqiC n=1 Tax=Candidatus Methylospira mobilis TaxID=1808979 RepID=A0A5Q0BPG0_9GAMM|nr:PqiC family protein [Candidatus Methylospira mobilis]QFY45072.1 membrane integrity-associated transporter subunit PqiC [Candidatus Methylospira mobilis]
MHAKYTRLIPLCSFLLLLAGCFGKSPAPDFYLLEPLAETGATPRTQQARRPVIALSPVSLPKYVDRTQIVQATARNSYQLNETQRWAEPLSDNIDRVLAENLARLVPADVVSPNSSSLARQAEIRIQITIVEFHVTPEQSALLRAQWSIRDGDKIAESRQSEYRIPASSSDYRLMVNALNGCIDRLSRDVADAARQQIRPNS